MKLNSSLFRTMMLSALLLMGMAAEARVVTGTVKDPTGETIISASVVVKGTTIGTVTDFDGNYTLEVPDDAKVLIFSYIGMKTQELNITGDVMNVVLSENSEVLEEVVVTGYGTTKKRDVVTSVASVGADQLKDIPVASAAEALQGKLAGVSVVASEGSPDAELKVRVRGGTSLTQSNDPLYIVDGFPVSSISDIAPGDIASMDVLKDAAATAIYGAQGANGVIIITTKDTDPGDDKMTIRADYTGYMGWRKIAKKYDVMNTADFVRMNYEYAYLNGYGDEANLNKDFYAYFDPNYDAKNKIHSMELPGVIDYWNGQEYHYWQDEIFSPSLNSNHTFNISGGTKNANFSLNYNRVDDESIMYGSNYSRNNFSLKTKFKPLKGLTIAATVRYANTNVLGAGTNSAEDAGSKSETRLRNVIAYTPINVIIPEDEDADYGNIYEPKIAIDDSYKNKVDNKLTMNGYISYKFLKYYTLKAEIGYENRDVLEDRYYGASTYYARQGDGYSFFEKNGSPDPDKKYGYSISADNRLSRLKQTNTFEFARNWNNAHDFNILLGEEIMMTTNTIRTTRGYGFDASMPGETVFNILSQSQVSALQSYVMPKDNMLSFFTRANYNYKGRYYASFTFRADASTRFAKGHQWGYFPSGAVAWRMIEEPWMEPAQDVMSNLKLRFSYGTAGNNNVPLGYLSTSYLADNTKAYMDGMSTMLMSGKTAGGTGSTAKLIAANENLTWETTVTRDLGLDLGFFNERLTATLDLYWNTTKDLILLYSLYTGGYDYQYRNIGSTDNKGVEFSVKGVILDKRTKSLSYGLTVDANISHNKNTIVDLGDLTSYEVSSQCFSTSQYGQSYEYKVEKGGTIGDIYGYKTDGIYTTADFASYNRLKDQWCDADGKPIKTPEGGYARPGTPKYVLDGKDSVSVLGNALPIVNGGFNVSGFVGGEKWGKVDLAANFTYSIGNSVVNMAALDYTTMSNQTKGRNLLASVGYDQRYSLFREDGTYIPGGYPAKVSGDDYAAMALAIEQANEGKTTANPYVAGKAVLTDKYVEDGSFLRLASLTIGYTLAEEWTRKAHISKCRFFFSASNLFCATKYSGLDPEVDTRSKINPLAIGVDYGAFPKSRSFNFGVNLSFE